MDLLFHGWNTYIAYVLLIIHMLWKVEPKINVIIIMLPAHVYTFSQLIGSVQFLH